MLPLGKSAILGRCIERVSSAKRVSDILVATSTEISDQAIVEFCLANNTSYHLGSLDNVVERLWGAAQSKKQKAFLRICGDSPFIDPKIIDEAISIFSSTDFDLVTNVFPRSFPKGQSVEIIKTTALGRISKAMLSDEEREHATSYFYNNHLKFKIGTIRKRGDYANSRHCIDDKKDFSIAKRVIGSKDLNGLGWEAIEDLWIKASQSIIEN